MSFNDQHSTILEMIKMYQQNSSKWIANQKQQLGIQEDVNKQQEVYQYMLQSQNKFYVTTQTPKYPKNNYIKTKPRSHTHLDKIKQVEDCQLQNETCELPKLKKEPIMFSQKGIQRIKTKLQQQSKDDLPSLYQYKV